MLKIVSWIMYLYQQNDSLSRQVALLTERINALEGGDYNAGKES